MVRLQTSISFRASTDDARILRERAQALGCSAGAFIRMLLRYGELRGIDGLTGGRETAGREEKQAGSADVWADKRATGN